MVNSRINSFTRRHEKIPFVGFYFVSGNTFVCPIVKRHLQERIGFSCIQRRSSYIQREWFWGIIVHASGHGKL